MTVAPDLIFRVIRLNLDFQAPNVAANDRANRLRLCSHCCVLKLSTDMTRAVLSLLCFKTGNLYDTGCVLAAVF